MSGSVCGVTPAVSREGFLAFVRLNMGIPSGIIADDSPWITWAYCTSLGIVDTDLLLMQPGIYNLSVYNLAADNLVTYAQDSTGTDPKYWFNLREKFHLNSFVAGVVSSSSDNGTSSSLTVPDWTKNLTLMDLQLLKTPWGRQYLMFAQMYGPNVWGLS